MSFLVDNPDVVRTLFTRDQIADKVQEIGAQVTADYAGQDLLVICVLRGAATFMADLVRAIDLPVEMDYMCVSSYGNGVASSGVVRIVKDLDCDIRGRHVLIAEDVIDSGLTLKYLIRNLESRSPASVEVAALLHKPLLLCNIDEIDGIPAMNAVRVYLRDPALEYPAIKLIRAARHIPAVRHISGKVFPFFQSFKRARTVVIEDVPIAVRNDDRIMQ